MRRLALIVAATFLGFLPPAAPAAQDARPLADRIEIIHTPRSVVVGLRDFDLLRRRFPGLRGSVTLLDAAGQAIDTFSIDYAHEATPSHIVFAKDGKGACARVRVKLADDARPLLEKDFDLPAPVASAGRAVPTDETAHLERGTAFDAASAPAIRLIDYGKVAPATIGEAPRTVEVDTCKRRVVADFNYPSPSGKCFVTRQTAAPDDPSRQSLFIPCNSDLYDPKTGAYESTMKYLIEIPLDPAWVKEPGDSAVQAPLESMRVHMTTEEVDVPVRGRQRINGSEKGLLGQTINSTAVDDEGNLYFSMTYRGPVRFNIKKARWEAPPAEIYEFEARHRPPVKDLPYAPGQVSDVRPDFSNVIYYHNRRIYVLPTRYSQVGKSSTGHNSLFVASVMSMPVDNWEDKAAFEKALRFNAGSAPGSKFPLWSTHVEKNDDQRKLNFFSVQGNRIGMVSYHMNAFWALDLNDDGSTKKLVSIGAFDGKRIERFVPQTQWAFRGDEALGLQLGFLLEGEKQERRAFLPMGSYEPTADFPKGVRFAFWDGNRGEVRTDERSYGLFVGSKRGLGRYLGAPQATGTLTMYYDAVARMKADPGPFKDVLDKMNAASMGPEYYVAAVPGGDMEVLGTSDYPSYNFAKYDCSEGAEAVRKTFLARDTPGVDARLNLPAALGLYCHAWLKDGGDDVLYYAGYTGIARLRYRRAGEAPARHSVDVLGHRLKDSSLDGAPDGFIKWYRDILPGLGDKVLLTGVNVASRGGTAYSGGLLYFSRSRPETLYRLSGMSRAYKTNRLAARLRGAPGGELEQDIFLRGNYDAADANTIPADKRPSPTKPRVFVYRDAGGKVADLFGFTLEPAAGPEVGVADAAVSPNGLFLLLTMQDGTLTTFDLDSWRFVDAVRLPGASGILRTPDGGRLVAVSEPVTRPEPQPVPAAPAPPRKTWRTYVAVDVDAKGVISLAPRLRLVFPEGGTEFGRGDFLYDSRNDDGSYDWVIGPNFRKPEGSITIIRDFVPPRPEAAAALKP